MSFGQRVAPHHFTLYNHNPPTFGADQCEELELNTYNLQHESPSQIRNARRSDSNDAKRNPHNFLRVALLVFVGLLLVGGMTALVIYTTQKDTTCNPRCMNGGSCVENQCQCPSGFTGTVCESALCSPSCVNGNCTSPSTCTCNSGWNGTACNVPICSPSCENNGTCSAPGVCTCTASYNGSICQYPICSPACEHDGNCTAPSTCQCPSTYSGATCTDPVCSSPCMNGGNCTAPNTCTCTSSWTDITCATPICSPSCQHGGTCSAPNTCTCTSTYNGSICEDPICSPSCVNGNCTSPSTCTCNTGWNGTACNVPICSPSCQNNGTCNEPDVCTCTASYNGSICQYPICSPACEHDGNCTAPSTCQCPSTYSGATCTDPVCPSPCVHGGNCTAPNTCTCTSSWTDATCATPICSPSCQHGGTCSAPNTCTCTSTYNGSICEYPICSPSCVNGDCTSPSTCTCNSGWNGTACNVPICSPSCQNNGTCSAPGVCTCTASYNGSICQYPICSPPCQHGGNCTAPSTCQCPSTYSGATCTVPVCSSPCVHGGNCTAPNTCTCTSSWTGATCATPVCSPNCSNAGTCIGPNNCSCIANSWSGSRCQTPICNNSCLNGGNCTAPQTCTCTSQYNGSTCAIPICTTPCQNSGNCTAPNTCKCATGYNGTACQYPVCNPSCLNGGTCSSPNTCQCTTDVWTGPYCQTPIRILWKFDNDLSDYYGNFPGVGINGPLFRSPGITGYGSCIYLNSSASQSVTIYSPPFLNMAQTSFSLVAWVIATSLWSTTIGTPYGDNAIFGQFQENIHDKSLHIIVRNRRIYLGFYGDDIQGNQVLVPGVWYHMAYVYDYSSFTQFVYVNGVLDVSGSPKGPYQGVTGDLTIGTNGVNTPYNFWDGCIDQVTYSARAKNATEILREATLSIALSFDNNLLDSGPLGINGTGVNYSFSTSGRVNQSLSLFANISYVQMSGLVLLGTVSQPYSLAIWIKPTVITSGTIIHVSSLWWGSGWCIPMLGFDSTGRIGFQSWNGSFVSMTGPAATANVWTHLVVTYGSSNGIRLWVNGTQYGSASGGFKYVAAGVPVIATLGSSINGTSCSLSAIAMGQYYGYMDEFQIYSRELSASDISALANP